MGDVFLDAFLDTLKILPFLLIMNFIIELLEYRSRGLKMGGLLKGGFAPLLGTAVGVVPQCGFSVVATELYGKRRIALGTLLAVYIATSDEALPIMLSSYAGVTKILPVIIIKVCFALIVGYATLGVETLAARRNRSVGNGVVAEVTSVASVARAENNGDCAVAHKHDHEHADEDADGVHVHGCHRHSIDMDMPPNENATKKQKAARVWHLYFKHPLLHTATVVLYIFIVNVLFGITVHYVGEDRLMRFIEYTGYLQPVLAAAVGLIPNCAASVVITELYVVGGLSLGGAVAGLSVGAGIGYAVLAKQNRPIKNTIMIIAVMYVLSVALGICVNLVYLTI